MQDTVDLNGGYRHAGQGRQQYTTQAVAQSRTVAAFQRLHDKFAVGAVFGEVERFDAGLFNLNHAKPSLWIRKKPPRPLRQRLFLVWLRSNLVK